MRKLILILMLSAACAGLSAEPKSIYDFTMNSIEGQPVALKSFSGKVVLLVNVASKCGFTPQYAGLEALYEKYKDRGLVIVGVPANNFAQQEPGTNAEIAQFCSRKYNVKFPMMAKVSVLGDDQTPLYTYLTAQSTDPQFAGDIKWNFTKFLFDRSGKPVARFEPNVTPDSPQMTAAIESALGQSRLGCGRRIVTLRHPRPPASTLSTASPAARTPARARSCCRVRCWRGLLRPA